MNGIKRTRPADGNQTERRQNESMLIVADTPRYVKHHMEDDVYECPICHEMLDADDTIYTTEDGVIIGCEWCIATHSACRLGKEVEIYDLI